MPVLQDCSIALINIAVHLSSAGPLFLGVCSIWVFFHKCSRFLGQQVKWKVTSLTLLHQLHPFYRHLDINRALRY